MPLETPKSSGTPVVKSAKHPLSSFARSSLAVIALFGLIVPNGLFVRWLLFEPHDWSAVLDDHLAMAFMLDAFLALVLFAWYFATRPIGPVRARWFVVLALIGGLGFALPAYWLWNEVRPELERS